MTFQITNDDTGRTFTFASEEAYERALDWYNSAANSKDKIVAFCKSRGVSLDEHTTDPYFKDGVKLVSDWADVAMELYARDAQ